MPTVLPPALVSNQQALGSGVSPQVVVDPINPSKMVVVASTGAVLTAYYSTDAGSTWTSLINQPNPSPPPAFLKPFPNLDDPQQNTAATNPVVPFAQVVTPSVTFDRTESVYIVEIERNATSTLGALVLQKYDFSGLISPAVAPTQTITNKVLYSWGTTNLAIANADPIFNPIVAVDNNQPSYTDPQTGVTQVDTMAQLIPNPITGTGLVPKGVYIAWNTSAAAPTGATAATFTASQIQVIVSPDGGNNWTNPKFVSNGNYIGAASASPRIAFTQGTADGTTVPGGQMVFAWDKFVSGGLGTNGIETAISQPDGGGANNFAAAATTVSSIGPFPIVQPVIAAPQVPVVNTYQLKVTNDAIISFIVPSGSVTLSYGNTTASIPFDFDPTSTPIQFQNYLSTNLGVVGAISVAGPVGGPFTVSFNAGQDPTLLTVVSGPAQVTMGPNNLDRNISVLDSLTVSLSIVHPHIGQLSATLSSPGGAAVLTLFRNSINNAGAVVANQGIADQANLGTINTYSLGIDPNPNSSGYRPGVSTVFDDNAARGIRDTSITTGQSLDAHFRPESSSLNGTFGGLTRSQLVGTWTLTISDNFNNSNGRMTLDGWGLNFTGRTVGYGNYQAGANLPFGVNSVINIGGAKPVGGAANDVYTGTTPSSAATQAGIGPSVSLAVDNTLGSFSPYQGRLYIAYVGTGFFNGPADNTDVYLLASSDNGATWNALKDPLSGFNNLRVDDDSPSDNFSEGTRPQFEPSIAVDQTTGTLVTTYYDARYDPARIRVVNSIQASIDGGQTFSQSTYLNTPKTATDAITGQTVTTEPIPGNQGPNSGGITFGDRQGLAVVAGRVYSMFSSNQNIASVANITTATTTIAAGPRIIGSDMGPILQDGSTGTYNNTFTSDGTRQLTGFTVTFDRFVDPATFTPNLVTLKYQNPSSSSGTFVDLSNQVTGVVPLNPDATPSLSIGDAMFPRSGSGAGSLLFPVVMSQPQTSPVTVEYSLFDGSALNGIDFTAPFGGTGTVIIPAGQTSALIPVPILSGSGASGDQTFTITIGAPSTSFNINRNTATGTIMNPTAGSLSVSVGDAIVLKGVNGTVTARFPVLLSGLATGTESITFSTLDGTATAANGDYQVTTGTINFTAGQANAFIDVPVNGNSTPTGDLNFSVQLSSPVGLTVDKTSGTGVLVDGNGKTGATTFLVQVAPQSAVGTYSYAIAPFIRDRIRSATPLTTDPITSNPAILDPTQGTVVTFHAPASQLNLAIPTNSSITSTLSVSGVPAGQVIRDLTVNLTLNHPIPQNLTLQLVGPDGTTMVTLAQAPATLLTSSATGGNFFNTTFDDTATTSISTATPPYRATFRPVTPLRLLLGQDPNFNGSFSNWTLKIRNFDTTRAGTLVDWSMTLQTAAVVDVPPGSSLGNFMDQNQNAVTADLIHAPSDVYAVPNPVNGVPFQLPYSASTLPLIIPGPHPVDGSYAATVSTVSLTGFAGSVTLAYNGAQAPTPAFAFNYATTTAGQFQAYLSSIPGLTGAGSVSVSGPLGGPFTINLASGLDPSLLTLVSGQGQLTQSGTQLNLPIPVATTYPVSNAGIFFTAASGMVSLSFNRAQAPVPLAYDSTTTTANQFQAYLSTIPGLTAPGSVSVSGPLGGPFVISLASGLNPLLLGLVSGPAQVNVPGTSKVSFSAATGAVTLAYSGNPSLAPLSYDASSTTASQFQSYLSGLPGLTAPGSVSVTGNVGGPFTVVFGPGTDVNQLTLVAGPASISAPLMTTTPGTATSAITVTGIPAGRVISDLNVTVSITHENVANLQLMLIAPDGTKVPLVNSGNAVGADLYNTTFDDQAASPLSSGTGPYRGSFQPVSPLSSFNSKVLNGTWTLQIQNVSTSTADNFGVLNGWSMTVQNQEVLNNSAGSITVTFDRDIQPGSFTGANIISLMGPNGQIQPTVGGFVVTANPPGTPVTQANRTFQITGFPAQTISGTYTMVFGPDAMGNYIKDVNGNAVDANFNAGLNLLRGGDPSNGTTLPNPFASGPINVNLPPGQTVSSSINVPSSFLVQGATITLNIQHQNDPDLTAVLFAPDGTSVQLFSGVGTNGSSPHANFTNTTLDDTAATPIQLASTQSGGVGISGTFTPQFPLSTFKNHNASGKWTLVITSNSSALTGRLVNWTLTLKSSVPGSGLGEPVADQFSESFRIFVMDPTNSASQAAWTAVGPNPLSQFNTATNTTVSGTIAGRVSALAVDPSDPTGNTVFVGAATGGVWKSTNFLTTDPSGPTYLPLTNVGLANGLNIGSIAVFARNNDPNQSIVFVATGEGDTASPGVGLLRSLDGGKTWRLLDSQTNVDALGNILAINDPGRNHVFLNQSSFKVIVDPKALPNGNVIVYVAFTGAAAGNGVWRSTDTGNTWTRIQTGNVTDIALSAGSADATGNLQVLYAGVQGSQGVFYTTSAPSTTFMTQQTGGAGVPLRVDDAAPATQIAVTGSGAPAGAGRIVLATPPLTGNPLQDILYQGWLYDAVVAANNTLAGLFVTKDFGQNWTQVHLPVNGTVPTNNNTLPDYNVVASQGQYDISLVVDPTNPNIVYLGGASTAANPYGLIRVDITALADPYSLVAYKNNLSDGGAVQFSTAGPLTLKVNGQPFGLDTPGNPAAAPRSPYFNMERDPNNPFLTPSTLLLKNITTFRNTGLGAVWTPFNDSRMIDGSTNVHRIVAIRDPLTGTTRLIFGDDQGVWTGVDNGSGVLTTGLGSETVVNGSRNGNLQLAQFLDSASQPSILAADLAGALFYGMGVGTGFPTSAPNILSTGNLNWTGSNTGTGTGVVTDPTGSGTAYEYKTPLGINQSGFQPTDFFQVLFPNGAAPVSRTTGLVLAADNPAAGTGDWPSNVAFPPTPPPGFQVQVGRFAVNPIDPTAIVISSGGTTPGRIFRTAGPSLGTGVQWFVIANPADIGSSYAQAMAWGAPSGPGNVPLDNFIYAGTAAGSIFVTFTGGGAGGGASSWKNISGVIGSATGLDGSAIQQIVADPARGSHDLYAVTLRGVYYMADSTATTPVWRNITSNLSSATLTRPLYNDPTQTANTLLVGNQISLSSIQVDWRYAIPNSPTTPSSLLFTASSGTATFSYNGVAATSTLTIAATTTAAQVLTSLNTIPALTGLLTVAGNNGGPFTITAAANSGFNPTSLTATGPVTLLTTHPVLYVGGLGGVYRSLDSGTTWTYFPDVADDGAVQDGGNFPSVSVTKLQLSVGNLNPADGLPNQQTGLDLLMATTFGQGAFAIRLNPNVMVNGQPLSNFAVSPVVGPHVISISSAGPSTPGGTDMAGIQVTFNSTVDPSTFNSADVLSVIGPSGATIPVSQVLDITPNPGAGLPNPHNVFELLFATPQSANGFYNVKLNPTLSDYSGNQMDQNQNGINGEVPGDIFSGRFLFQPWVNHAPVLNVNTATIVPSLLEDQTVASNSGTSIASFIAGLAAPGITDPDNGPNAGPPANNGFAPLTAPVGIAITAVDSSNGTWQYSQDGGVTWTGIGVPSSTSALLLDSNSNNRIRFLPNARFSGAASFTFKAWDETSGLTPLLGTDGGTADTTNSGGSSAFSSVTATASLTVLFVNHAPSFTKGANQTVLENSALQTVTGWATNITPDGLQPSAANEANQVVNFVINTNNNALFSTLPTIDAAGNLTYTPAPNVFGSATVSVQLHDNGGTANGGVDTSAVQTFTITVTSVNQAPSFTKGPDLTNLENAGPQTVAGWATNISAGPPNESGQIVNFLVNNNNSALFSSQPTIAPNGTLTYTVAANAAGTAKVTVRLHDNGGTVNGGVDTSAPQTFNITVSPVNQAPSFTKGADQTILENASAQTVIGWSTSISAGPPNESSQVLNFIVSNDNNALFSVQPSIDAFGNLTYTPALHHSGLATVTVQLHDDGGTANGGVDTSAAQTFTVNVLFVNDQPSFSKGADQTILENAGLQTVANWATNITPDGQLPPATNEAGQSLNFIVTSNNQSLFSAQPNIDASGNLTYTPAPNASGSATVTVQLHDNGGVANGGVDTSASQTFTITVQFVNHAPSFVTGSNQTVLEDAGPQTIANWATKISPDQNFPPATNEAGQTLNFLVSNDTNALFSVEPAIAPNGTLTYTPAPNTSGTAMVTVKLQDNGGVANGGVDTSTAQTFTINVQFVNDAPSFTKGADQTVLANAGPQTVVGWATNVSPDGNSPPAVNEKNQNLNFIVSNNSPGLFSTPPNIAPNGALTYVPAPNAFGTATVSVQLHDDAGIANGGIDTSAAQTFLIQVLGSTQTMVTSDANPSVFGQKVTFTATISNGGSGSGSPTGTVDFFDATTNTDLGVISLIGNTATLAVSSLPVQTHNIVATYSGDSTFQKSSNNLLVQTVMRASTTTTVSPSISPSVFGQTVTFTATVTTQAPGSGIPVGSVSFMDGSTLLGFGTLNANGVATFPASNLAVAGHTITATYINTDGNNATSSGQTFFNVGVAGTTTGVSASPTANLVAGQTVTLTATVTANAPGSGTPTGSVTFKDGNTTLGSGPLNANGVATFSSTALLVGNHNITATYNNSDGNYSTSGGSVNVSVGQASTTTGLTFSATFFPLVLGEEVTLTATVTANTPGSGTPTGTVTFTDGATTLGNAPLNSSGVAILKTTTLSATSHSITASYNGDSSYQSSSSGPSNLTVGPDLTTTVITPSPTGTLVAGQPVTLTATVSVNSPGAIPLAVTSLSFSDNGTVLGTAPINPATGVATLATSLVAGTNNIVAFYPGDSSHQSSAGLVIINANQASTTTTLTPSPSGSLVFGQNVTYNAQVKAVSPSTGIPTGTVSFKEGATVLDTELLDSTGSATFSTSSFPIGGHTITAVYNSDGNYITSTSTAVTQVVFGVSTTTITSITPNPVSYGRAITINVSVQGPTPASATPTGSVSFMAGPFNLGSGTLSGGLLSATVNLPITVNVGTRTITATYSGDGFYGTSLGTLNLNVNAASTTTILSPASSSGFFGTSPKLTASVVSPSGAIPTGSVTFTATNGGGSVVGTQKVNLDSNGQATFSLNTLDVGNYTVTASFNGSTNTDGTVNFSSSNSSSVAYSVAPDNTITTLSLPSGGSFFGQPVTFNANVLTSNGGQPSSGTVNFTYKSGATSTTTAVALSSANPGLASLTLTNLAVGTYQVTAQFVANNNLGGSNSGAPLIQTISKVNTSTSLTSSLPGGSVTGQSVTLTAKVTSNSPSTAVPTGTVTFKNGATTLGTGTLNSSGVATLSVTTIPFGSNNVTANYNGGTNFASSSAAVPQQVSRATTMTLVSSANPFLSSPGTGSLTATVTATGAVPTGTVTFFFNGGNAQVVNLTSGKAVLPIANAGLLPGVYAVSAQYGGNLPTFGVSSIGIAGSDNKQPLTLTVIGPFDHLSSAGLNATAGIAFTIPLGTILAQDANNQTVSNYSGKVSITLDPSSPAATLNGGNVVIGSLVAGKLAGLSLTIVPKTNIVVPTTFTLDITDLNSLKVQTLTINLVPSKTRRT